jgi:threonyl-tRNA synthetase
MPCEKRVQESRLTITITRFFWYYKEMSDHNYIDKKRHSLAHVLLMAVKHHYPHALPTIGPVIENGFYYDIDFSGGEKPSLEDLPKLEATMREIVARNLPFRHEEVTADQARGLFEVNPFKRELIDNLEKEGATITLYYTGDDFYDLCMGGHTETTGEIKEDSFKLDKIAGAYWRGNEKNAMLTRIYGLAFDTKDELDAYIAQQEEAKKRDHRILGEKLDLFHFEETIGKGLPIWLPKGNIIKEELENWAKDTEKKWGYQRVTTPIITKENLFYTSGHLPLYKDSMYAPLEIEGENYYIKPMNCPFHHKVFSARMRSYKELPLRIAEYGWCHRYEDSGSLFGLMRVRGMQMNDAHIYVQKEKAVEEFVKVIKLHEYYYKALGIENYEMELALRDPSKMDKYHGNEEDWKDAEEMTVEAMKLSGVPYKVVHEGAAFYGPKMDFQIYSSIGRAFTASTNQLDLYMGKAFKLEYVDSDGQRKIPAVIHRAPLGTHERFIGFLIEHFGGNFPLWLSPTQISILPIADAHQEFAKSVSESLRDMDIRAEVDSSKEGLGKKIRNTREMKTPYWAVIGDAEVANGTVTLEHRTEGKIGEIQLEELQARLQEEIKNKK